MQMVCKNTGISVHKSGDYWYHDIDVPDPHAQTAGWYSIQLSTICYEVEDLDAKME